MKGIDYKILSKTIAHALRHEPELYGLQLDSEGWAEISALLQALRKYNRWKGLEENDIIKMNQVADKKRFEIKEDKIRAFYGHSAGANITKQETLPPEILFHGTNAQAADIILKEGLQAMERQFVHLSADEKTALQAGERKPGKPVILLIEAKKAAKAGVHFYPGNDTIWLADSIAPEFITLFSKK